MCETEEFSCILNLERKAYLCWYFSQFGEVLFSIPNEIDPLSGVVMNWTLCRRRHGGNQQNTRKVEESKCEGTRRGDFYNIVSNG